MIDTDANPNNSEYCYKDFDIASVSTKLRCDVYERVDKDIKEASVYFLYDSRWISAVYIKEINPSKQSDYASFMNDLKCLVTNYTKKWKLWINIYSL